MSGFCRVLVRRAVRASWMTVSGIGVRSRLGALCQPLVDDVGGPADGVGTESDGLQRSLSGQTSFASPRNQRRELASSARRSHRSSWARCRDFVGQGDEPCSDGGAVIGQVHGGEANFVPLDHRGLVNVLADGRMQQQSRRIEGSGGHCRVPGTSSRRTSGRYDRCPGFVTCNGLTSRCW